VDDAARGSIFGRSAELTGLGQLVLGAARGRGGIGWVQGEPGVGKSAVIDTVLTDAGRRGFTVLHGAGDELRQPFPLRLMADCLNVPGNTADPLSGEIAGLLRGDLNVSGGYDPVLAAGERMLELVDRLGVAGPVVLAVEDLHWADEPSLLIWARLARVTDQIPLLLLGTTRPPAPGTPLDRLRQLATERGGMIADLGPLDAADAASLAGSITAGRPGPRLRTALDRAGGNPLYIRELTDALVRDGAVKVAGGEAELHGKVDAIPVSLQVAIGRRLGFMTPSIRTTMQLAALLGNEFDVAELASVTTTPVLQLADTVREAVAGGVLSAADGRLRFRHELIHQVLVEETPAAMRPALHGEIARMLTAAGRPVDSVARHLLAVPGQFDDWALAWLAAVPEQSLHTLPPVSADLLERAAGQAADGSPLGEVLGTRLATALLAVGRNDEAGSVARRIAGQTADPVLATRMRIMVLRSAGRRGQPAEGLPFVLRSPGDDALPPKWLSRLGSWSALILRATGHLGEGTDMMQAALQQAESSGDPLSIAYARHAAAMSSDTTELMCAHIEAALAVLTGHDPESVDLRLVLISNQLSGALVLRHPDEVEPLLAEALAQADRAGTYTSAAILSAAVTFCYRSGRWDAALVHLASMNTGFAGTGPQLYAQHGIAALISLRRGDLDQADVHLQAAAQAMPTAVAEPPVPVDPVTQALAMRAEASGEVARAAQVMSSWLSAPVGMAPEDRNDDLFYLVRLALAAGDTATAADAVAAAQADAVGDPLPGRVADAEFCAALLASDPERLLAIAAEYARLGWPPYQAAALEEAAVRLAVAGDATAARAALTSAAQIYTELGATWDIRRADARLRSHGVRRGPRSIHRRATTGWAALTPAETHIAHLVAQGLSNPDIATELFLSRRTVQTHVSNILSKLGVRSRIDIAETAQSAEVSEADGAGAGSKTGAAPRTGAGSKTGAAGAGGVAPPAR
jgi:DNA-binding CsgD family transcriptional regulator